MEIIIVPRDVLNAYIVARSRYSRPLIDYEDNHANGSHYVPASRCSISWLPTLFNPFRIQPRDVITVSDVSRSTTPERRLVSQRRGFFFCLSAITTLPLKTTPPYNCYAQRSPVSKCSRVCQRSLGWNFFQSFLNFVRYLRSTNGGNEFPVSFEFDRFDREEMKFIKEY